MHIVLQEEGGGAATRAQWWESSKVREDRICRVDLQWTLPLAQPLESVAKSGEIAAMATATAKTLGRVRRFTG
jgi:hypothetical protein